MKVKDKELVWLSGEVKTPPFSESGRMEAGFFLRKLQQGKYLSMPHSRSMGNIGKRCHELRIKDVKLVWRIVYRIDSDAIVILEVFKKQKNETPKYVIDNCRNRITRYDQLNG